ncbi:MAG: SEC-C metal-binding domain-containing protein, partial [Bryobacteraceae bacterium]
EGEIEVSAQPIRQNSTLSTPAHSPALSNQQAQVVALLARGATVSAAANQAGIHRASIYNWQKSVPEFARVVLEARVEYTEALRDQMKELSAKALNTLHALLDDATTPAFVRLRVALAILQRPSFPNPTWNLPEPIGSPQQQELTEQLALVRKELDLLERSDRLRSHQPPEAIAAEDAPETSEPEAASDAVPRNAPCPCGKGLKYKRCCGRNAAPVLNGLAASAASRC